MTNSSSASAPLGPVATPSRGELPEGTRALILAAVSERSEGATVEELAESVGVHANSVRNHLAALVEVGLVNAVAEAPSGRGRPAFRYAVSVAGSALLAVERAGHAGGGAEYRALAEAFARHLATRRGARREARAVGELWGAQVIASRPRRRGGVRPAVLALLTDLGFAPDASGGDDVVLLRACPLLESAQDNPEVICQVHLGLVTGARAALDGAELATGDVDLVPFAQPGACRLTLPA